MSEVQKALSKAKANEDEGNFDKAARNYFTAAELTNDLRLFNKAFFTARKSGNSGLMFQTGKTYYDLLDQEDQKEKIKELIPTFLEISGRERDRLADSPEEMLDVLEWTIALYQLVGNLDAAYEISHEAGDAFFSYGQQFLSTSHLLGKEEKWQRGLDLFDSAIEAFQQIRLDTKSLEKILNVKLDKISKLIDIGRHIEGIENVETLLQYFRSQPQNILPYTTEVLSLNIANIFAKKTLDVARNKKFNIADVLVKTTKAGFENAGKYTEIGPFLWQLAMIYDEFKQRDLFFTLIDSSFDTVLKYEDITVQNSILGYLEKQGTEICNSIISSRLLMVKKAPIEFQNNEGIHYLLKNMELAKKINNVEILEKTLNFLFQYSRSMYEKKLTKQSLPYFEFCAQNWWDLSNQSQTRVVLDYLESNFKNLITIGKFNQASQHLGSIISIKMFIGEVEEAGDSAFSLAKAAGQQAKQDIEINFLKRAYDAFESVKASEKLQRMTDYITQQLDPLFNLDSKSQEPRDKLIQLGDQITSAISDQANGKFLQATTFKALNSGLINLGIDIADKAFEVIKKFDFKEAADLYFKIGSGLIDSDMDKALELITKSTEFSVKHEPLSDLVERNLNYIQERALTSTILAEKVLLAHKLELLTKFADKMLMYNNFLFTFTQNLAEESERLDFFNEMKNFLVKAFYGFHSMDSNHTKLSEILTWTSNHISESYSDSQHNQIYELAVQNLAFHETMGQIEEYITFFWKVFDGFASKEDFDHAVAYFKQLDQTFERVQHPKEVRDEITGQVVSLLDRNIKPKIADEKFEDAWPILEGLYSLLDETGLHSQAISLYIDNAQLFAPHRLDLALTMWSQAIDKAKVINDNNAAITIAKTITEDFIPLYAEKGIPRAVNELYSAAAYAYKTVGDSESVLKVMLNVTRFNLSISDFNAVLKLGTEGLKIASKSKIEESLFEFADMFFAVGSGLLTEDTDTGINLIKAASDHLQDYEPSGYDYYCIKMAEIYEALYNSPLTQKIAQNERSKILQHFKESGRRKEEGRFLVTSAKLSFQAGNVNEGLDLISQATTILKDLDDEDGLSDIVSVCLKTAAKYHIGTEEYIALSNHAAVIQETSTVEISEEKTQEAFVDLFDGLLDDMTKLMDPEEREKRRKEKKKKK
ncbi:MAG: hypothetical protein ACFFB2_12195 [Promethearchaeota archaeon]